MQRRGVTLIELLAVLTVLSIVALAATGGFSNARVLANVTASTEGHRMSVALRTARSAAMRTGVSLRVRLLGTTNNCTGYAIEKWNGVVFQQVSRQEFDPLLIHLVDRLDVTFLATGEATASFNMTIVKDEPVRRISVALAGAITDVKL